MGWGQDGGLKLCKIEMECFEAKEYTRASLGSRGGV